MFPPEVWTMNVISQKHEPIEFPRSEVGTPLVRAAAYSPDDVYLADAVIYPATMSNPKDELEVGIRTGEQGKRVSLLRIPGGVMIPEHGLRWSPDSRWLIIVVDVAEKGRSTQLWLIDIANGTTRMLMKLAEGAQYGHPAVWAPDGRNIAVLKVEPSAASGNKAFTNVYLVDPETGANKQITRFTNRRLSRLSWSPNARLVAFTLSQEDYGEIWVTDLDGIHQYPIAGPTVPDASFIWLP